jgi:general secretion pathway protein D
MVVTTQVKYLRKIQKLLDRIDIKPMQVNIEGKIVEVDQGVSQQMGINWNAATVASSLMDPNTLKPVPNQLGSFNTGLTGGFTSQLQTAILVGQNTLNSTIQAMVDLNKADIVSAPNITTNDNQAATISTTDVQVYANSTTTISNGVVTLSQTFTNSNIPLTLVVTPKISKADRRIMMNINFQLTTTNGAAPGPNAPAPTSQQSAITNVSVNSGDTAVIGGLVRQNNTSEVRKVPVLGDIPLLGLLFKFTTVNKTKKEVIIFITPTIVED